MEPAHGLRASPLRLGIGLASSGVLAVAAGAASLRSAGPGSIAVLVGALGLVGVLLWDYPIVARLDPAGIERRSVLRVDRHPWDEVERLTRMPRGTVARTLDAIPAGMVAHTTAGRRVLVIDRREPLDTRPALLRDLHRWAPDVGVDLP